MDIRQTFKEDVIQTLLTRYATPTFEASLEFVEVASGVYPVLLVPRGITVPITCKRDLRDGSGQLLPKQKTIYVRTMRHGNVSTSEADGEDLKELIETCIANRELDNARFLTRFLQGMQPEEIRAAFIGLQKLTTEANRILVGTESFREDSVARFRNAASGSSLNPEDFGFRDIALMIDGPRQTQWSTNQDFLSALHIASPNLSGWPVWLVSTAFQKQEDRPYVKGDVWEQYIVIEPTREERVYGGAHWDFSIFDPSGRFFLRRVLPDDFRSGKTYGRRKLILDPIFQISELAEALITGQRFASAMLYDPPKTFLYFHFWWSSLEGRTLASWAVPGVDFFAASKATDNERQSKVRIPMDATLDQVIGYIGEALKPLTQAFGGYEIPGAAVAFWVNGRFGRES